MSTVEREQLEVLKDTLHSVCQLLTNNADQQQVSQVTELMKKLDFSSESTSEKFSNELDLLWQKFQAPKTTVLEHISRYESYRLDMISRNQTPPDYRECFVVHNSAYYALDPATATISDTPLQYPEEPSFSDFALEIEKSPISGVMCLVTTVKRFLARAERCGMTRDHVALMLKQLVRRELPEFYSGIKNIDDPFKLFRKVTSFTDFSSEKEKITAAISSIIRSPGESIVRSANVHNSLCQDLIRLENADLSEEEVHKKADRETSRILRQLVESSTWNALQIHVGERMATFKQKTSLDQQIRFIMKTEERLENKIVNPKKLRRTDVSVALFNTTHANMPRQPENLYYDDNGMLCHDEEEKEEFSYSLRRSPPGLQLGGVKSAPRPPLYENAVHDRVMRSHGAADSDHQNLHRYFDKSSPGASLGAVPRTGAVASNGSLARSDTESPGTTLKSPQSPGSRPRSPKSLADKVMPREDMVRGRPQTRGSKLYRRSPGGSFRSVSKSRVYSRERSKSAPRGNVRPKSPAGRAGARPRSMSRDRSVTRSASSDSEKAPCKLCGFYPGKGHRQVRMCPVFGKIRSTAAHCTVCLRTKGVHAFHPEIICGNKEQQPISSNLN